MTCSRCHHPILTTESFTVHKDGSYTHPKGKCRKRRKATFALMAFYDDPVAGWGFKAITKPIPRESK